MEGLIAKAAKMEDISTKISESTGPNAERPLLAVFVSEMTAFAHSLI